MKCKVSIYWLLLPLLLSLGILPTLAQADPSANVAIKRMGYKGKLVAHGLRSLASTVLNEAEFPQDIIEAALAHVDQNAIRGIYNRAEYLEQRRKMMQWWSDHIEEAATGKNAAKGKKHLKVVETA